MANEKAKMASTGEGFDAAIAAAKARNAARKGRRIGGDSAGTYDWRVNPVVGKVVSYTMAKTRHGIRTRLVMEADIGGGLQEIGLWIPERWHTTFEAESIRAGSEIKLARLIEEGAGGISRVKGYEIELL